MLMQLRVSTPMQMPAIRLSLHDCNFLPQSTNYSHMLPLDRRLLNAEPHTALVVYGMAARRILI